MRANTVQGAQDPVMNGKMQFVILMLVTTLAAVLLVAWTYGLLDRDDDDEGAVLLEHEWRATGNDVEPEFHDVNLSLQVPSGVDRVRVSYRVELPSDLTVGIPGSTENPSPEVRFELMDGSGSVVWSEVLHTSASSDEVVNVTAAGGWTVHVWARTYGYEGETSFGTTVEFHDSLGITVSET
jgi:hypothetical protein